MYFLLVGLLIFLYFTTFFMVATIKKNNSIVDIGWGLGFVFIAIFSLIYAFITNHDVTLTQVLISTLVTLWALRLFIYISIRNCNKPEDFRYQSMRKKWGKNHPLLQAYFKVFLFQGLIMSIVATVIYIPYTTSEEAPIAFLIVGTLLFLFGLLFESIADYQLREFLKVKSEKNPIMNTGLWRYTRHPNYFGETLIWWSLLLIILPLPFGILSIISPILMTLLLRFVSGVPLLEKKYEKNPYFQEYARKTSIFFPLPPKK